MDTSIVEVVGEGNNLFALCVGTYSSQVPIVQLFDRSDTSSFDTSFVKIFKIIFV